MPGTVLGTGVSRRRKRLHGLVPWQGPRPLPGDDGTSRRGDRVVDCAALEMLCAGNRTGGSNPPLSAERPWFSQGFSHFWAMAWAFLQVRAGTCGVVEWFAISSIADRGSWGRWREFAVEPKIEPKFGLVHQNPARSGAILKDLDLLARGCQGTWPPRVTIPERTQSGRDCSGQGRVLARGGGLRAALKPVARVAATILSSAPSSSRRSHRWKSARPKAPENFEVP